MDEQTQAGGKKRSWLTPFIFLIAAVGGLIGFSIPMGIANLLRTIMNTAYALLIDTCFYIMAIAVIMGALDALLTEFGVVDLLNKLLNPLMKPLFGMPGAAALGVVSTYLSDNPAILSLAEERGFRKYFKKYQFYALTNLGTSFGMGIIVSTFMLGLTIEDKHLVAAVLIGNLGAVIGAVVSTRLMIRQTRKLFGEDEYAEDIHVEPEEYFPQANLGKKKGPSLGMRVLTASLSGGKSGVEIGLSIIPGVLVVCTLVMLITKGPSADGTYTGAAYEGVALLP